MSFRSVQLLWLLAALPLALLFLVARERTRTRLARLLVSDRLRGVSNAARVLRPWVLGIAIALALLALAGPYAGYRSVPLLAREANRILVIDVSNSMAAEDVGTSRLAAAKALAMRMARAQDGRVALIVFEGQSEVISPLTTDGEAVASLIDTLQTGEVGQPGSDLGTAVITAMRLIEADPLAKADIVVLTDGEDQGARVGEAVQRAKSRGVAVSSIVIGSAQGATIPTPNGPLRDTTGEIITTFARTDALRELTRGTDGTLLTNPFADRALDPLLGRGPASIHATEARVPIDRYQWPLALAFFAFLGGSLLHRGGE